MLTLGYLSWGLLLLILPKTRPYAKALFCFAKFIAFPMGKEIVKDDETEVSGAAKILWMPFALLFCCANVSAGILCYVGIVTIPAGRAIFRSIKFLFNPVGVRIEKTEIDWSFLNHGIGKVLKVILKCLFFIFVILMRVAREEGHLQGSLAAGNSSSGGSGSRQGGARMYWYQCKNCGTTIKQPSSPSTFGCPSASVHSWTQLGEVGDVSYQCRNCGTVIQTKNTPSTFGCPSASVHSWTRM